MSEPPPQPAVRRRKRRPAFSLIELLASAVILSILAVMGVPYAQTAKDRQVELELKESLVKMRIALDSFAYNEYPDTGFPNSIDNDVIRAEDGAGDPDGDGIADDDWDGLVDEDGAPMYPRALDTNECRQKFGKDVCTPLDTLVAKGYLASIPRDPLSVDRTAPASWTLLWVNRRFNYRDASGNPATTVIPGVVDIRSKAKGVGLAGTAFNSW